MDVILEKLLEAVEFGKVDRNSPYPPQLKGQDGAHEHTINAINSGIDPKSILEEALIPAMGRVGKKFSENKIFVPQMLMAAKAMGASMVQLKPFFTSGEIKTKGTFIIGTVKGDLHDIGKNLVASMLEGCGFEVINIGVDISSDKFVEALKEYKADIICMSALLTTTMDYMKEVVAAIEAAGLREQVKIMIGGAPVNSTFAAQIGADAYSDNANSAVQTAKSLMIAN